jgi:hypothetical protein
LRAATDTCASGLDEYQRYVPVFRLYPTAYAGRIGDQICSDAVDLRRFNSENERLVRRLEAKLNGGGEAIANLERRVHSMRLNSPVPDHSRGLE